MFPVGMYTQECSNLRVSVAGGSATAPRSSPTSSSSAAAATPAPASTAAPASSAVCPRCIRARTLSAAELESRMRHGSHFLLLDCRSFIAYNLKHINGALNVSCADRFTKRRLAGGRTTVGDLISGDDGRAKDIYQELWESDFVVYDDATWNPGDHGDSASSMHTVLEALAKEGKDALVLRGGLEVFQHEFPDLCGKKAAPQDRQPRLVSPTTPVISNKIDSTDASQILPFLYLGNERDAKDGCFLRSHHITHILNVTSHVPNHFENEAVVYKRLAVTDSCHQNLNQYFSEVFDFIDACRKSGGRVLVHCQAGVSRSATVTIAYLMKKSLLSMTDAYRYLKTKRDIIAPNFNFMGQLMEFEQVLNSGKVMRDLESPLPCFN